MNVPTTNNHCESYHSKINSIAGDQRYTINNRLSLLAKHIMNRLKQLDQSSLCNLRTYKRNLKKKAKEKVFTEGFDGVHLLMVLYWFLKIRLFLSKSSFTIIPSSQF